MTANAKAVQDNTTFPVSFMGIRSLTSLLPFIDTAPPFSVATIVLECPALRRVTLRNCDRHLAGRYTQRADQLAGGRAGVRSLHRTTGEAGWAGSYPMRLQKSPVRSLPNLQKVPILI